METLSETMVLLDEGGFPDDLPEDQEPKGRAPTQAGTLLELVNGSGATFFHTDSGDPYAAVPNGNHKEIRSLDGRPFRVWLSGLYYRAKGKPVGAEAIKQAIDTLAAKAIYDSPEPVALHTRIAAHEEAFWYDKCDPEWRAIKIEPSQWSIESPPIIFERYSHQAEQITPIVGGELDRILKYIPLKESPILFLCWLIASFIPGIPHPVLILYGEKGASKSTSCEFIKSLIDPSKLKTMTLSNDERTLAVNLQQHWFLPFDNVSFISESTSDTLCRAVTGGGIQQRKLYTNAEDTIFTFQRVLAINGINNTATRPDLLDRSLLVELRRIPEDERRELVGLQESFERDKPDILGGIFDVLADAMEIYPTVKLDRLPRMADFNRWSYAIGEAMGKGGGERFLKEYAANRETQNMEAINSDPVATLILALMESRTEWSGTSTDLYKSLEVLASDHGISTKSKSFPADPPRLSKRINGIRSNLEAVGIVFDRGKSGSRNISFKQSNLPSVLSFPSKPAL